MRYRWVVALLSGITLFLSGFALGQRNQISQLYKYLGPAPITTLDLMLIHADLAALRDQVGYGANGIAPARFFYEPKTDKLTAFVLVNGVVLNKESSGAIRDKLSGTARHILTGLRISLPELSDHEFEVEFSNMTGTGPVEFCGVQRR